MNHRKKTVYDLARPSVDESRHRPKIPVILVADSIRSMNNVGSMFRTADAFGIEGLLLCGITGCPPHPEIFKSALGAEQSVEWSHEPDTAEACRRLRAEGYRICVLEQAEGSVSPSRFSASPGEKIALVVGNEVEGVRPDVVEMADTVLEIPQYGIKHSLNVSVAAGIALWTVVASAAPENF